jgi:hypothetical protein
MTFCLVNTCELKIFFLKKMLLKNLDVPDGSENMV